MTGGVSIGERQERQDGESLTLPRSQSSREILLCHHEPARSLSSISNTWMLCVRDMKEKKNKYFQVYLSDDCDACERL